MEQRGVNVNVWEDREGTQANCDHKDVRAQLCRIKEKEAQVFFSHAQ